MKCFIVAILIAIGLYGSSAVAGGKRPTESNESLHFQEALTYFDLPPTSSVDFVRWTLNKELQAQCDLGDLEKIRGLIDLGANLDSSGILESAIENRRPEIALLLIE